MITVAEKRFFQTIYREKQNMGPYIHLFDTEAEFNAAYNGNDYVEPWVSYTVQSDRVDYNKKGSPYLSVPLTVSALENGTFYWPYPNGFDVQYSKNGGEWTDLQSSSHYDENPSGVELASGDEIALRGNNQSFSGYFFGGNIIFVDSNYDEARFDLSGNIMSLVSRTGFETLDTIPSGMTFAGLFRDNRVVNASDLQLPATTLSEVCYNVLFEGCTDLVTAPELPATTLASDCYSGMFYGCTSLTTAPALPATVLARRCYIQMFRECTSLVTGPSVLPAPVLADYCYDNMFNDCTSLTTAPEIQATIMGQQSCINMFMGCTSLTTVPPIRATTVGWQSCYYMFYGCTSLVTAPGISATTLDEYCFESMFQDCTSLTTAPSVLPATVLANYCYARMFGGCTNLTSAPELPATDLAEGCYEAMFNECTSLTSAPELPATDLAAGCYAQMFNGCTNLTSAPGLPATTLADYCYSNMFESCSSLTSAPVLSATTFVEGCYYQMFYGCSSLNYIKCLATSGISNDNTEEWVVGVSSSGTFVRPASTASAWAALNSGYGIPPGWTAVNA